MLDAKKIGFLIFYLLHVRFESFTYTKENDCLAELHHFYEAPAPGKNLYTAPPHTPSQQCLNPANVDSKPVGSVFDL
jgi:hypothetical protein